jgi:LuxR family maltose regulon positive regulatory protein
MGRHLVETKLFVPRPRRRAVPRPRLAARLSRGADSALTLVSAPAGFGKTTVLAEWLGDEHQRCVAWLSLDEHDSPPASFWTYVINALQRVVPGVGASVLPLLQSAQPPIEAVLATVLNELGAVPDDVYLVLDDYHLVDSPDIRDGMAFLLEHLPPHMHLVISTRADPALPLARFRARGELVEVRAAQLRFTPDEVSTYLTGAMGLDLGADDVAALEERTEGWIAALQLAALSMQGRADVTGFVAGFTGDDRYVVDYLVEEVLGRQPDDVRTFLLQTSILDRLSGPLCDAVTGQRGAKSALESLERANLFVVPLDDHRRWYRYHHLFADVLRTHLHDERRDEISDLHLRASRWYEEQREPAPAVHHAMAAGDVDRAAALVELAVPDLQRSRQETTIQSWIEALPDEMVRARPVLTMGLVGALMSVGHVEGVEQRLRDAERLLEETAPAPGPDAAELARLPGMIPMYRAGLALVRGDVSETVEHARTAIARAAAGDHLTRAAAAALSGLAYWGRGNLADAHAAYSSSLTGLQLAGHVSDVLGCSITVADIQVTQGRLSDAMRTYEHGLRLAADHAAGAALRGTADMHVGMSRIACERGDLEAADRHLSRAQELGEANGLPQNPYRRRVAMAWLREAHGDLDGALRLLNEAQRVYAGDFSPNVKPVPASIARVLAAQGRVAEALDWAGMRGLSVDDDPSYLREYEHITLARVKLAQHRNDRATVRLSAVEGLLERLLAAAEEGERGGSVIEILVLQALVRRARGDTTGALGPLQRALTMAEPDGWFRVFSGEGPPMSALLGAVARQRPAWRYVRRLLGSCDIDSGTGARAPRREEGLVVPLSEREIDVLRLLGSDLAGPDIARELVVSLNTLRTHTKNIYAKLGVTSRRAAVHRARELDLMPRAGRR